MARADMRGSETRNREPEISPEVESEAAELVGALGKDEDRQGRRFGSSRVLTAADRDRILKDARTVEFPVALRGYDRTAVDRYVERMSRLITELEMSSSPEAAVRHALDEVSEETRDILQRAHQTADEITARSRAKADDRLQQAERESQELQESALRHAAETRDAAKQEAAQVREAATRETTELREAADQDVAEQREAADREVAALRDTADRETTELRETADREVAALREKVARETQQLRATTQRETEEMLAAARRDADEMRESAEIRARELARSAETIWRERRRLIEDMRAVGEQLVAIGETEGKRFPRFGEEGSDVAEFLREPAPVANGSCPSTTGTKPCRAERTRLPLGERRRGAFERDRRQAVQADVLDQRHHLRLGAADEDLAALRSQAAGQDRQVEHHRGIRERQLREIDGHVRLGAERPHHRATAPTLR